MKKNFLMVASLLIAAMLMVVSCSQEVKAPVDNNLVEVTLNTSAARGDLNYTGFGDSQNGSITYRYKLTAKWNQNNVSGADQVVGNTANHVVFSNGANATTQSLGFVSQGLWEVDVIGSIGKKDVLHGSTQVYFNKKNSSVTVYVKPINDSANARIELDVHVNDHDTGSAYKLVYSIETVDGSPASGKVNGSEVTLTNKDLTRDDGQLDSNGFRKWSAIVTDMTPGYYRVTVTMMNGTTKVGGLTKGVLLFAEDTSAKLSGYVNSSDFIEGTLNVHYPSVNVEVKAGKITAGTHVFVEGEAASPSYDVTYTAEASIANSNSQAGTPTYTWYADGVKLTGENNTETYTAHYKQTEPGYKTVTCVVNYTFSVTGDDGSAVEFKAQGADDLTTLVNGVTPTTSESTEPSNN